MAHTRQKITIVQIAVGHWHRNNKHEFSVMGLGSDMKVYRWLRGKGKWQLFHSRNEREVMPF